MNTRRIGAHGEEMAQAYLRAQGYEIRDCNFHAGVLAEIDIVASYGETLVFTEVKLRSGSGFGEGREAVDARKQRSVASAARVYLAKHRLTDVPCRFDVIEILLEDSGARINHYRNAFECSGKDW